MYFTKRTIHIKERAATAVLAMMDSKRFLLLILMACSVVGLKQSFARRHNATAGGSHVCVDFAGVDYVALVKTRTNPSFYISLHREKDDTPRAPIMYTGTYYETVKTKQLRDLMTMRDPRMQGMFLDVGANIGWFTLYAAALGRHVVAFEPNHINVIRLKQSIGANGFTKVLVKPFGAGPSNAVLQFRQRETNFGMGTFVHNFTADSSEVTEVLVRKIDDELKNVPPPWIRRVALVKIDVEGFEAGALQGMLETLRKDNPLVYLEFNNARPESDRYYETIWAFIQLGYRHYTRDSAATLVVTSLEELRAWFDSVVHTARGPSDFLFLPGWISDEEVPF